MEIFFIFSKPFYQTLKIDFVIYLFVASYNTEVRSHRGSLVQSAHAFALSLLHPAAMIVGLQDQQLS